MPHHGSDVSQELMEQIQRAQEELGLGATGNFPKGKMIEDDEGELKMAVSMRHENGSRKVIVNFGKPVAWIGLDAEDARNWALLLDKYADLAAKTAERIGKKIVLLDFDGVIHSYTTKWEAADVIPDPPVPGAINFLKSLVDDGRFEVCIYSSRSRQDGGVEAMKSWLFNWGLGIAYLSSIDFPTRKPAAFLTIDDRCHRFQGAWPTLGEIAAFKPWKVDENTDSTL